MNGARGDGILAVEFPGGSAGSRGKRKQVQVGKRLGGDEVVAFLEERVGFAGESDHDVGADGGIGQQRADLCEALGVMPGTIAAVHAAEDGVGSRLQGQMRVGGQPRMLSGGEFAVEVQQVARPVHGLDGAEAKARETRFQ